MPEFSGRTTADVVRECQNDPRHVEYMRALCHMMERRQKERDDESEQPNEPIRPTLSLSPEFLVEIRNRFDEAARGRLSPETAQSMVRKVNEALSILEN